MSALPQHPIEPARTAVPAPPPGAAVPRPAAGTHALVADLSAATVPALEALFENLFRAADDELSRVGERSASDAERRRCLDLMRLLSMERAKMLRAFAREVGRSFNPLAAEPVRGGRQSPAQMDEQVALTNLASKAKQQQRETLADLHRRIEHAVRALGVPLSVNALTPARLCAAFGAALEAVDAEVEDRLLLHPVFDRCVLQNLSGPYAAALQVLERHGIRPPGAVRSAPAAVDAPTLACLEAVAGFSSSHAFADGLLAAELLAGVRGAVPAVAQRLALAGQLFHEILPEAHLAPEFARAFEALRWPMLKSALADPAFFTRSDHPVRRQLGDAALAGAFARLEGASAELGAVQALGPLAPLLEVPAASVQAQLKALAPLADAELLRIVESQREELARRRDALLARVRRHVEQVLESKLLAAPLPAPALPVIRSGLGPLLAVRLLRDGGASPSWTQGLQRLDQLIDSLGPGAAGALRAQIVAQLPGELAEAGLAPERIAALLDGLRAAHALADRTTDDAAPAALTPHEMSVLTAEYGAAETARAVMPDAAAANDAPSDPREILRSLLQPRRWFRVFDPGSGATQWLQVAGYYPQQDSVGFTGLDGEKTLCLRGERVLADLLAARTEPIEPTREMSAALGRLRALART